MAREGDVDKAFKMRLRQETEAAREAYLKLRVELGLGRAQLVPPDGYAQAISDEMLSRAVDVVLLGGSLARAQGKRDKALAALHWAESTVERFDLDESFYFKLETGIRAHLDGDFDKALNRYTEAQANASTGWQKTVALINSLIAMEMLGLEGEATLASLNAHHEKLAANDQIPGVASQLRGYNLRAALRRGDIAAAVAPVTEGAPRQGGVDQPLYLSLWVQSLPYTRRHAPLDDRLVERLMSPEAPVFQRDYRLRTLRGVLHPDDLAQPTPYDAADRVYSWVWRWLVNPERAPVFDALRVLTELSPSRRLANFTCDDRQVIGNAMLWLGLFAFEPRRRMTAVLARLERAEAHRRGYSLYDFERTFIDWCYALRDGDDTGVAAGMASLKAHPMWKNDDLLLPELACAIFEDRPVGVALASLESVANALRELRRDAVSAESPALVVNAMQATLTPRGEEPSVSEPMVKALCLLREKSVATRGELLRVAFGIGPYDPILHERKIFNLLSRLKAIRDLGIVVKVKSGFVVANGDWRGIRFIGKGLHAAQLMDTDSWRSFLSSFERDPAEPKLVTTTRPLASERPKVRAGAISARTVYTRSQIERLIGRPRSTVARWLAELVAKGLVKRAGRARATSYQIIEPERFVEHLNQHAKERGSHSV